MKKTASFIAAMVFIVLLNGCATTASTASGVSAGVENINQFYFYELFRVSKADHSSIPKPSSISYDTILSYKESLKDHSVEYLVNGRDSTRDDIFNLLIQGGLSLEDTNNCIKIINTVGNNCFTFEYAPDNNYYVIVYYEKL